MFSGIVVVTGVPAAGKSTIARMLAEALSAELLSLDEIKERLFDSDPANSDRLALRLAAETELWTRIEYATCPVVIDIWVAPGRDDERVAAAIARHGTVVEVLCRVSADVAVQRYIDRVRSGPHQPADAATLQRIREAVTVIRPLGICQCFELDTEGHPDLSHVFAALDAGLP